MFGMKTTIMMATYEESSSGYLILLKAKSLLFLELPILRPSHFIKKT